MDVAVMNRLDRAIQMRERHVIEEFDRMLPKSVISNLNPRVHPNGFIQMDLRDGLRLHLWDHRIPRQETNTAIHDHVFSMQSAVIEGRMMNLSYNLEEGNDFKKYRPVDDELGDTGERVSISSVETEMVWAGNGYSVPAGEFHESIAPQSAVTIIEKTEQKKEVPDILVPNEIFLFEKEPDNSFDRYDALNTSQIWDFFGEIMTLNAVTEVNRAVSRDARDRFRSTYGWD